jgi:serine/threonine-protein kinase
MSPHSHSADRNLLFGIIALQMDFITRDQLIAAMAAWVVEKHKSLGQVLCEHGALSSEDREAIESLVRRQLLRHNNDSERSLAALSSIGQRLRDDLSRTGDLDVQQSLTCLSATERDAESTLTHVGRPTTPGGRFRILRPHAQGGLGVVSVALDQELHREVALKEIQERYASDEQPRLRFLLEAEITGGLEHPGIVPVYGLGHHPDGRPFYAMRFVRGESLKEAVARFHGEPGRVSAGSSSNTRGADASPLAESGDPGGVSAGSMNDTRGANAILLANNATPLANDATPSALRRLLSRFLDVCNAIAYAHSRGVLHRDIKPGNILLGPYGETLVVDWGLAKIVGHDEPATTDSNAEPTLRPPSASGTSETIPGTALGTPAYMSPEQAEGRLDLLGPASDVYSLGATLYAVLTGRAPFDGSNAAEILPKVQRGEFAGPRALNSSIARPLEAICVKAMALKPGDRYASPRALAEDIEHWLADEPVSAYHESWPDRARRWSRTHRTLVTSAAAVLLVGLLGSLGFGAVVTAKNRDLARQTHRAESRERMAIKAVERFRDAVVGEPRLKNDPALGDLRMKLLQEPLAFFQSLRVQLQVDKDTRAEALARLANAAHNYAHLAEEIGDIQDSLRSHAESLAIWEKLVRDDPSNADYWHGLAAIENCRGNMLSATGRPDEAIASYVNALVIRERLARESPSVTEFQRDLATSHVNTGLLQRAMGHPDEALGSYGKALAIQDRLARENPSVTEFQRGLADTHNNIGAVQSETGRPEWAVESYGKALTIRERLARDNPSVTEFQSHLADTHHNIGTLQSDTGHPEWALASHGKALAIRERLARDNPSVTGFQRDLALSHHSIGRIQSETGHREKALESYSKALAIQERLARDNPSVTEFQSDLEQSHNNIGILQGGEERPEQAMMSYAKALAIAERLAREHPELPAYASSLGGTLNNMAAIDVDARRFEQAREKLQQAISWQKKALAANPRHPTYRQFLRNHLTGLTIAAKGLGNDNEARAAQRELDELAANDPAVVALDARLSAVLRGQPPKDNSERLRLAGRAYDKKLYPASARLYAEALAADPRLADDRQAQNRYNAACSAALAAFSGSTSVLPSAVQGEEKRADLRSTEADRTKLRKQALAWLEVDLTAWSNFLGSANPGQRQLIAETLKHWQQDTDLANVRDEAALTKLPDDERKAWKSLWANVEALLIEARKS